MFFGGEFGKGGEKVFERKGGVGGVGGVGGLVGRDGGDGGGGDGEEQEDVPFERKGSAWGVRGGYDVWCCVGKLIVCFFFVFFQGRVGKT